MEEYNNEKYMVLENVENLFKRINRFGNEYNYCFSTFKPQSALPIALGAVGGLIEVAKQKNNISGYFVNKNENEICLIPVILDDHRVMQIDINGYILIKVKEPNAWRLKHRIMYEKYHNVKLTSDDAVIFADQNKLNLEKDNLILISKSQLLKMNNEKLIFNNKELTKTGANIAELMMKVDERKKKNE